MRRQLLALALAALLALGCVGCSGADAQINRHNAQLYVQGVLDETYTGQASDAFLTLVEHTQETARNAFQTNLKNEFSQRLALRFELKEQYLSHALRQKYLELLETVYGKASYAVKSATALGDGRYCVEVSVTPVTFFAAAYNDGFDALLEDFEKTHALPKQEELDAMEPAQARKLREKYENDWARAVYNDLYARLDAVTTGDAVTKLALLTSDSQGLYTLSATDLQSIDDLILQY